MSKSIPRRRRNLGAQLLAASLVVSVAASSWAAPGDITTIPAPILGSDPPKARDISDGDASVSTQTGALTYGYPITVPPGRMGMQPNLSLSYSSQAPVYGGVADGWSLGIPEIRLDTTESVLAMTYQASLLTPQAQAQREKYITTLSGSRPLVPVNEPAGVATDVMQAYRAANDDSYVRYERLTSSAVGLWRARAPEGLVHTFGEPALWTGGTRFAVPLTSTEDSFGNRVEYQWANQQIVEIRYTSNVAAGLPAFAKVQFDYVEETCPGARLPIGAAEDLRLGTKEGLRKLTKITAIALDAASSPPQLKHTREYTLGYDAAAASCSGLHGPQRVLTSIQESAWITGQAHVDLPPVTFQYNRLERTFDSTATRGIEWGDQTFAASLNAGWREGPKAWNGVTAMMLDFDGDALLDRIELYDDPAQPDECKFTWTKNLGRNPATGAVEFDTSTALHPITMPRLPWGNGHKAGAERCFLNYQVTTVITHQLHSECTTSGPTHLAYRWLDVTSDGLPDLVAAIHHDIHFDPGVLNDPVTGAPLAYADHYYEHLQLATPGWPSCTGGLPDGGNCPGLSGACMAAKLSCLEGSPCNVPDVNFAGCVGEAPPTSCGLLQKPGSSEPHCMPEPEECVPPNPTIVPQQCTDEIPHQLCDRYPWIIYKNHGGASIETGQVKLEPAPLESESGDSPAGGGGQVVSRSHAIIDIDGDGHIDLALRGADFGAPYNSAIWWVVFRGNGTGEFLGRDGSQEPYIWLAPKNANVTGGCTWAEGYCGDVTLIAPEYDVRSNSSLLDLNGDGAVDFVWSLRKADFIAQAFFNDGRKFRFYAGPTPQGDEVGLPSGWLTRSFLKAETSFGTSPVAVWNPTGLGVMASGWKNAMNRPIDLDDDGRVDLAWSQDSDFPADPRPRYAYVNSGGSFLARSNLPEAYRDAVVQRSIVEMLPGRWATQRDLIDMDGDGLPEQWHFDSATPDTVQVTGDESDQPLRLLRHVDNGRGGAVDVVYAATTDSTTVTQDASAGIPHKAMPHAQWVVKSLTVLDQWDDPSKTEYSYRYPIWSPDERGRWGFRGFEQVTSTLPSGAKVVDAYGFDVDWSGRLKGSRKYAAEDLVNDEPVNPSSISETTWTEFSLFGGSLKTYHSTLGKSWTCSNGQSELACKAANSGLNTTSSIWTAQDGQLWAKTEAYSLDSLAYDAGDRHVVDAYHLYSTPGAYRLRQLSHAELELVNPATSQYRWTSVQESGYDAEYKKLMSQVTYLETLPSGAPDVSKAAVTKWDYDATGAKQWTRNPRNSPSGPVESYAYDATRRFVTSVTNELGQVVTSAYESGTGAQLWQQGPNGAAPNVEQTWTDVDGLGRPTAGYVNRSPGSGAWVKTQVSRTTYRDVVLSGARTNVVVEGLIDYGGVPRWTREETRLDGQGRPTETIVKTGASTPDAITTFDYDNRGNLVSATLPDPTQNSSATVTYTYTFDSLGRPIGMRRPAVGGADPSGVNMSYDGLTSTTEEVAGSLGGPVARKVLVKDNRGRLVEVREYTNLSGAGTYASTFYQYDGHDIVSRIQNPDGVVTELVQDLGGRRTAIMRGGRTWTYEYNVEGQMTSETVPGTAGTTTNSYVYGDSLGRLTSRTVATRGFTAGDLGLLGIGTITFAYDGCANGIGRLCMVTHPSNRVVTAYAYDSEGNTATTTRTFNFGGLIGVQRAESFTYGPGGRVVVQSYADNQVGQATATKVNYTYDDRAKPLALSWTPPAPGTIAPRTVATQTRNVAGLVTKREATLVGTPGATGWRQFRSTFAYDKLTRVASQTITSATDTAMSNGVVTHASQALGYYGLDDPSTLQHVMGGSTYDFTFGYDPQHQLTSVGEAGGKYNATFAYGVAASAPVMTSGSGKLRSAKVCTAPACTVMPGGQVIPRNVTYQYATGSTTIEPEAPTGLVNTIGGAQLATYTYESSGTGNLKTSTRNDMSPAQTDTFAYDGEDQLRRSTQTKATTPITTLGSEEYYYDHNGQRVGVVTRDGSGTITGTRIFAGDTEIEFAANGTVTQAYAYLSLGTPVAKVVSPAGGWASSTPASWTNGAAVIELQYHGLSSNTLLSVGPTGTVQSGFVYAPYGDVVQTTGAAVAAQHRRFNDKFQDDLTKLSYYGVRYYDGLQLGWAQADPVYRFAPDAAWTEPRRANLYQFVLGNPVRYVDPDGRDAGEWLNAHIANTLIDTSGVGMMYRQLKPIDDAIHGKKTIGEATKGFLQEYYKQVTPFIAAESGVAAAAIAIAGASNEGEAGFAAVIAVIGGGVTRSGNASPGEGQIRPATQQPRGGGGVVLRDGEGVTVAEMAASTGGPTGGSRASQSKVRQSLLENNGDGPMICWRCGQTTENPSNMHVGHRNAPTSQGGNLSEANVCLEGAACNLSAGASGAPAPGMSCAERGSCGAPYGRDD